MSRFMNYFSKTEIVLWVTSVIVIIVSFCAFDKTNYMTLCASLIGVTSLIFNAKGNPVGQVLMIVFSILYGIISYTFAYYGEMITYLGMTMPMAISSAMIPLMVSAEVSPGMQIISRPTEQTAVIASSFSSVRMPASAAAIMPASSLTGMNAPERPPTWLDAMTPPFLTASLSIASAAVVPGPPQTSSPIDSRMHATLSPMAGVGARERSTMP